MNGGSQAGSFAEGAITRAFRERLRASPPDVVPGVDGVPLLPPRVPGLADFVAVGRGGTGIVYRARDVSSGETVAVKLLLEAGAISPTALARARREGEILARLDHPNIVRVLSQGELRSSPGWPDGLPYLVMEWLEGSSLQRCSGAAALPARDAVRLVRDLARVLAEVHARGVVHRDLKPANVMLVAGDTAAALPMPKVVDFGLARHESGHSGLTPASGVIGTPEYMAPEQAGVTDPLVAAGPATDIHGLGGILFFLLFGRAPYEAKTVPEAFARVVAGEVDWPSGWTRRISVDLRTILEKCLDRLPARRYASAAALADDLDRFLDRRPIVARRSTWPGRIVQHARRRPAAAVAAVFGALFVAAAASGLWAHRSRLDLARRAAEVAQTASRRSLDRLTGESLERMIVRSPPLDESSVEYLRGLARIYGESPAATEPPAEILTRIRKLEELASTFVRTERIDDAIECLDAASSVTDRLPRQGPVAENPAVVRFGILDRKFATFRAANRLDQAEAVVREMLALIDELPREKRGAMVDDVAHAQIELGFAVNAQGRVAEALPIVADAIDRLEQIGGSRVADGDSLRNVLDGYYLAAAVSASAGRSDERRARLEAMVEAAESAVARFPADGERFTEKLVLGLASLADAEAAAGRFDRSLAVTSRLQSRIRSGMDEYGQTNFFRQEWIEAAIRESVATRGERRPDASRAALEEALTLARREVAYEPAVYAHAQREVKVLQTLGLLHEEAGRPGDAIEAFKAMIAPLEPWADVPDRRGLIRGIWCGAHRRVGGLLRRQGDSTGAVKSYERALAAAAPAQRAGILVDLAAAALEAGQTGIARLAAEEATLDPSAATVAYQILAGIPD